jgi:hypothetical protein
MSQKPAPRRTELHPGASTPSSLGDTASTVTVKLAFDASGNADITFTGGSDGQGNVTMTPGTDTITFQLDSASAEGSELRKVLFSEDSNAVFSQSRSEGEVVVTDRNTIAYGHASIEYDYGIKVRVTKGHPHHGNYQSADPKIINEPPAQPPL